MDATATTREVAMSTKIHDTKNPIECCERCATAEKGRRAGRSPKLQYSQTAKTGKVRVVRAGVDVAVLTKDSLFGWIIGVSADLAGTSFASIDGHDDPDRRVALHEVQTAYTAAWRNGEVR